MKYAIKHLVLFLVLIVSYSCKNSTEPEKPKKEIPYMSLHVGDIRQFYEETGATYFQWQILDTTKRSDRQKVFKLEEVLFLPEGYYKAILYCYIKNNYYIITNIDTVANHKLGAIGKTISAKYNEQKLATIEPKNGDIFLRNEEANDSIKVYFRVSFVDSISTQCGVFKTVAQNEMIHSNNSWKQKIYYAPRFGFIGSSIENNGIKTKILATYLKVNGVEIGNYMPLVTWKMNNNKYLDKKNIPLSIKTIIGSAK